MAIGDPSFLELGVPDPAKARTFYGGLLGWDMSGPQIGTGTLSIGLHGGDPEAHFEVFFAVPALDPAIEQLRALGGRTVSDVMTSEGFGRWVECADDQGVRFGLREAG